MQFEFCAGLAGRDFEQSRENVEDPDAGWLCTSGVSLLGCMAPYWPAGTRLLTLIPLLQCQMMHSPSWLNDLYKSRTISTGHNPCHGWDIEGPFRLMHLCRLVNCTLYKVLQINCAADAGGTGRGTEWPVQAVALDCARPDSQWLPEGC